jgi:hypothetical protein
MAEPLCLSVMVTVLTWALLAARGLPRPERRGQDR